MSSVLSILEAVAEIALRLLDKLDADRANAFRSRLASDPVGVLLSQTGGNGNETITANSSKRAKGDS